MKFAMLFIGVSALMAVSSVIFCQDAVMKNSQLKEQHVIVIDPGHPSETSNGCSHNELTELQVCWDVALKLERLISDDPDLKAVKTKNAVDTMVTNRQRAEIANAENAALMLRLHCDSGNGRGCTLYYPDRQGTVQGITGPSESVINGSRQAAEAIQFGLEKKLAGHLQINPVKTDSVTYVGSKQGALTGSIFSEVPAVVIEMVYLNNASDAAFIRKPENQDLMAESMYFGIKELISRQSKADCD